MAKKYQMAIDAKTMIKDQSLLRHEDIKQHIRILPELAGYIPPLSQDEHNQLEENIKKNGCREALLVWETTGGEFTLGLETTTVYILIDGHNRYAICQKHQLDFKVHLMSFPSLEEVKFFMIDNQLGRRNLAPEQVSYLRGLRYLREKQGKGRYSRDAQKGQNDLYDVEGQGEAPNGVDNREPLVEGNQQTTAHRLGKQFNVSEKTIKRDGAYAHGLERLDPAFKQEVLSGQTKIDKALVQKLSQFDKPLKPIRNQAELEQVIHQIQENSQITSKSGRTGKNKKTDQLKLQLNQLVSQLNAKKANINQVCNAIIDCAQQLKEQAQ